MLPSIKTVVHVVNYHIPFTGELILCMCYVMCACICILNEWTTQCGRRGQIGLKRISKEVWAPLAPKLPTPLQCVISAL